jgi:hypothetical protein
MYPVTDAVSSMPIASNGMEKLFRIDGHATPNKPSGIPKAMKAMYAKITNPIFG